MKEDLNKKIEALETAIETMQEALYELKAKQRKIEVDKVQQNVNKEKKEYIEAVSNEKLQEDVVKTRKSMQEPEVKQVDISAFKPEPFNIIKFCQTWLPRIFVGIMLLGVIWLFKAGVDAGLLTPAIRVVFGIVLSAGLYYVGDIQIKRERQALGLVLAGGSITGIVLTTFAAHYLYEFIPASIAFVCNIIWVVLGIYLAKRYRSEYLAIFVAVGAFFVPFLLNSTTPNTYIFFSYETILTISLLWYALRNLYKYLYMISYVVAAIVLFVFFVVMSILVENVQVQLTVVYGAIHLLLFWHMFSERSFIQEARLAIFSANAVFFILAISQIPEFTTWGLVISAFVHAVMFVLEYRKNKHSVFSNLIFGFAMGAFSLAILYEYSLVNAAIVLLLQGFLGMVTAIKVKQNIKLYVGATIYAIGMVQTIFSPFDEFISAGFVAHIILIGTFYYCMIQAKEVLASLGKYVYSIALYSLMVIVFITITRIGEVLSTDGSIISVSVSLLWMVYALFAVWFGRYRQMNEILYAGLVVLVVTVGKLFLLDLPEVSMMIRAVLFLIVGSIGIVISRMFFSKEEK
ncbi:putative membrane protein [Bacillus mycoides]